MESSRELKSIGMTVFIDNYEEILKINNKKLLEDYFVKKGISNPAGAAIRAGYSIQVINDIHKHKNCLEYIAFYSKKATNEEKNKAKTYLDRLS